MNYDSIKDQAKRWKPWQYCYDNKIETYAIEFKAIGGDLKKEKAVYEGEIGWNAQGETTLKESGERFMIRGECFNIENLNDLISRDGFGGTNVSITVERLE